MRISRHARNNMRLYGIRREELEMAIQEPDRTGQEDERLLAYKLFPGRFGGQPLKVVYTVEDDTVVITTYPLSTVLPEVRNGESSL